jgi:hypothetical protein
MPHPETTEPPRATPAMRPDVIVDFSVDHGLLIVALQNIGALSAYDVTTTFDRPFHGLGGRHDISTLPLFRAVPFMPPGKRIGQLVDTAHAYFRRDEPTHLVATIRYADRDGHRYSEAIPHDLAVYRDLTDVVPHS